MLKTFAVVGEAKPHPGSSVKMADPASPDGGKVSEESLWSRLFVRFVSG